MIDHKVVTVNNIDIANSLPFTLIAGPCVVESEDHALKTAKTISDVSNKLGINFIYKSSFDKANRSSISSNRGLGMNEGLRILESVKKNLNINIITDVHEKEQCKEVKSVVDILQIPAFLCRQTDLLQEAAYTKKAVMVKKGQFLAPWEMTNVIKKLEVAGCEKLYYVKEEHRLATII